MLGAFKALVDAGIAPPVTAHLLVTIAEEVGHGASHGLDTDVAEMVSVDNAVVAPGQQSREDAATLAMLDGSGPFDYHFTRNLAVDRARSTASTWSATSSATTAPTSAAASRRARDARAALVGFGVDATHGHERTHLDGLRHLAELLCLYLQTDLIFPEWDAEPEGDLADFPSLAVQPASEEGPREGPIGLDAAPGHS